MNVHDRTERPVESSTHTQCKKLVLPDIVILHRQTRTNSTLQSMRKTSTNISGVPNAMVKRSDGINVHNLIQQIENHPQRQALQSDLQQHRAFNPFSKESKDPTTSAGNTELCEIVDVDPKSQCRACLTYWDVGIVYCTCGHFLRDDTTEKKYISSVLDLFAILNFYIKKGRPNGHKYEKKEDCKKVHTAKQLQKRCRKKQYENIHDRFIRDTLFRKTMIELGRSQEVILEMDRLASEDHSHIATEEEIDFCRGGWWVRLNLVDSDMMPIRRRPDFKKALSTYIASRKRRTKRTMKIGRKVPPHGGNGKIPGGIPIMRPHHKDGLNTDRTVKPVIISKPSTYLWHESLKEFGAQSTVLTSITVNAVHCPRRVV